MVSQQQCAKITCKLKKPKLKTAKQMQNQQSKLVFTIFDVGMFKISGVNIAQLNSIEFY